MRLAQGALLAGAVNVPLLWLLASVLAWLFTSAAVIQAIERMPWHDALYFVTTTLTTVGYGDVVVTSSLGAPVRLTPWLAGELAGDRPGIGCGGEECVSAAAASKACTMTHTTNTQLHTTTQTHNDKHTTTKQHTAGRLAVFVMMIVAAVMIPVRAAQLYTFLSERRATAGPPPTARRPFVLLSLRLSDVRGFNDLLSGVLSQARLEGPARWRRLHVVCLADAARPEFLALQELHDRQLTLVEGSALWEPDLLRRARLPLVRAGVLGAGKGVGQRKGACFAAATLPFRLLRAICLTPAVLPSFPTKRPTPPSSSPTASRPTPPRRTPTRSCASGR